MGGFHTLQTNAPKSTYIYLINIAPASDEQQIGEERRAAAAWGEEQRLEKVNIFYRYTTCSKQVNTLPPTQLDTRPLTGSDGGAGGGGDIKIPQNT